MDIPTFLIANFASIDRAFFETEAQVTYLRVAVKTDALENLVRITNEINAALNAETPGERPYVLDVYAAPRGLALTWEDLPRQLNNLIRVELISAVKAKMFYVGALLSVEALSLTLKWNAKGQMRTQQLAKENIAALKVAHKW